jgi:hypothetical protein
MSIRSIKSGILFDNHKETGKKLLVSVDQTTTSDYIDISQQYSKRVHKKEIYKHLTLNVSTKFLQFVNSLELSQINSARILQAYLNNNLDEHNQCHLYKNVFSELKTIKEDGNGSIFVDYEKQKMKFGKLLNKISTSLNLGESNISIEKVVDQYKSWYESYNDKYQFEIYTGDDILHGYCPENFSNGGYNGMLYSSCMVGKIGNLNIYTHNPEKISLLVLKDTKTNKISGRAFLWNLDKPNCVFMDRVYGIDNFIFNIYEKLALKNKWIYRSQPAKTNYDVNFLNKMTGKYMTVKASQFKMHINNIRFKNISIFPYVDSMFILDRYHNRLCNYVPTNTIYNFLNTLHSSQNDKRTVIFGLSKWNNPYYS